MLHKKFGRINNEGAFKITPFTLWIKCNKFYSESDACQCSGPFLKRTVTVFYRFPRIKVVTGCKPVTTSLLFIFSSFNKCGYVYNLFEKVNLLQVFNSCFDYSVSNANKVLGSNPNNLLRIIFWFIKTHKYKIIKLYISFHLIMAYGTQCNWRIFKNLQFLFM